MTDTSHVALQCITAPDVPPPAGHYSHAVKAGNWIFVSGVLPVTASPKADFAAQAEAALNLCRLAAADCGWPQVGAMYGLYRRHRPLARLQPAIRAVSARP
ncbi:MAG: RidA family protein [Sodalis sp. (in: enterobacteria)]|uniref:RidA family protein n=1 Tax=Sodalis sp. (in: enterobacteria) TaxID=1898979 RepID=UPI003F2CD3C8